MAVNSLQGISYTLHIGVYWIYDHSEVIIPNIFCLCWLLFIQKIRKNHAIIENDLSIHICKEVSNPKKAGLTEIWFWSVENSPNFLNFPDYLSLNLILNES